MKCSNPTMILICLTLVWGSGWIWFPESPLTVGNGELAFVQTNGNFIERALSNKELSILGTTNVVDGILHQRTRESEPSILDSPTLFLATWDPNQSNLKALMHSPDVCWSALGWRLMAGVQSTIIANLRQTGGGDERFELPFECRLMQSPAGDELIVAWAQQVGGEPLILKKQAQSDLVNTNRQLPDSVLSRSWEERSLDFSRSLRLSLFARYLRERKQIMGGKQMIRVSIPVESDYHTAETRVLELIEKHVVFDTSLKREYN